MAYRNGTYIAFDGNDTTDPTRSDMKYYGLLQAWNKDRNNTLSFSDSHKKTYMDRFADILQWIFPGWESRLFTKCRTFPELLTTALMEIWESTLTDYNQIALTVKISSHQSGLVVFADNISETKQRYRLVVMEGLMGNAFATGNVINVADTNQDSKYFQAVGRTKSELVIPIKFQGNVIGVINSESEEASHYTRAMVKKLLIISDALSIALNRLGYIANMAADQIPYIHIEF